MPGWYLFKKKLRVYQGRPQVIAPTHHRVYCLPTPSIVIKKTRRGDRVP